MSREEYIIDSHENSDFMYNVIERIINEIGPRSPCSKEEREASDLVAKILKEQCDSVDIEEFTAYPRAFTGWSKLAVSLLFLSFLLFMLTPLNPPFSELIVSAICIVILLFILFIIYKQFLCYEEWTPKIFPYKQGMSQNVVSFIKPSENVKKRVIFSGHIDSAFRFNINQYTKEGYVYFTFFGIISLFGFLIIYIIHLIYTLLQVDFIILIFILIWIVILIPIFLTFFIIVLGKSKKILYGGLTKISSIGYITILSSTIYALLIDIILFNYVFYEPTLLKVSQLLFLITIPSAIALFFLTSKKATPGAVDNLTAVAVCLCISKILSEWKQKYPHLCPKNTEVIILISGSEEIGTRGAEAFAKKHALDYNKIDTTCVNLESLTESRYQKIFTRENTTRVNLSFEVYNLLAKCCEELGIEYQLIEMPSVSGGTDAAGLVRYGLKAASLEGIIWKDYLSYYHTDRDNLSMINRERRDCNDIGSSWNKRNIRCAMENALKICLKYLELKDKE
ncbi:MAG: M28 family peptidase [Promethearchaeota archaeon]